jgi:hypothetical protein
LKHYFNGYRVVVKTSFLLGDIIQNKDANRRISNGRWNYAPTPWSSRAVRLLSPRPWSIL